MFDKTMVRIKKLEEKLSPIMKPVITYVYHRRGRFSVLGTVLVLLPLLNRPHHTWSEFEKDFRMYDDLVQK